MVDGGGEEPVLKGKVEVDEGISVPHPKTTCADAV